MIENKQKLTRIRIVLFISFRIGFILNCPLPVGLENFPQKLLQFKLGCYELVTLKIMIFAVHPIRMNFPIFTDKIITDIHSSKFVFLDDITNFDPSISIIMRKCCVNLGIRKIIF